MWNDLLTYFSDTGTNLSLIQTIAIVVTLTITIRQLRSSIQSNRATASLAITTSHREIWTLLLTSEHLQRVMKSKVDLAKEPLTEAEELFVVMVINHMSSVYDAYVQGLHRIYPKDMRYFLSMPIPNAVWERVKNYQAKQFTEFVENQLLGKSPDAVSSST